jgi:hypothetical protein
MSLSSPITQAMQHAQRRLVFAAGKKGGYEFVELTTKPALDEAGAPPNVGCSGMTGVLA